MFQVQVRGSEFQVRGSDAALGAQSRTLNSALRTLNVNIEHERGTGNMEPGTALFTGAALYCAYCTEVAVEVDGRADVGHELVRFRGDRVGGSVYRALLYTECSWPEW